MKEIDFTKMTRGEAVSIHLRNTIEKAFSDIASLSYEKVEYTMDVGNVLSPKTVRACLNKRTNVIHMEIH